VDDDDDDDDDVDDDDDDDDASNARTLLDSYRTSAPLRKAVPYRMALIERQARITNGF